jgi:hypothetical protein
MELTGRGESEGSRPSKNTEIEIGGQSSGPPDQALVKRQPSQREGHSPNGALLRDMLHRNFKLSNCLGLSENLDRVAWLHREH